MAGNYKRTLTPQNATELRHECRFLPTAALPPDLPGRQVPIADMANAFGVTHRTLHFYEEKGLISSGRMGLMRVYDPGDIMRMAVINVCREAGMAVAVIQELMHDLSRAASQEAADQMFRAALETRKRELCADMSTLHRQLQHVSELLEQSAEMPDGLLNDNQQERDLTEKELRCLSLMAEGLSTHRLARALAMDDGEARAVEAAIIGKFQANNRFQAIAKAVMLGVVRA